MEASRRQPGTLEGLSRFLVQHEPCGAGFDVAHPAGLGSGRVSITCRGCGARHEYATATIEVEREIKIESADVPQPTTPLPPERAPAAQPPSRRREPATPPRRPAPRVGRQPHGKTEAPRRPGISPPAAPGRLRRVWRSPRTTLGLLIVAAVALGFGVVKIVNGGGTEGSKPQPAPNLPATTAPTATGPTSTPPASPAPTPVPSATTTLHTKRFTIDVPRGWTERKAGGGLLVAPRRGGRVNVQIYFQRSPGLTLGQLADQTTRFMRRQVPGARILPSRIRLGGLPAVEITARGPGETAIAVDVLRGPYRYLLVRRIFAGAKPHTSLAAGRIVLSFRPL